MLFRSDWDECALWTIEWRTFATATVITMAITAAKVAVVMLSEWKASNRWQDLLDRSASAGLTTFLTMAYILFVNPAILGETGMDKGAVFVATCLAAAIGLSPSAVYQWLKVVRDNATDSFTAILRRGFNAAYVTH